MRHFFLVLCFLASPVFAVQPDEILKDPALEARARAISKNLRCLVCRNENIDDSNAGLARDLRLLVRERLLAGDSDEAAITYIVDRYGEYVLLTPRNDGSNILLWAAGPIMLLIGAGASVAYLRRHRFQSEADITPLDIAETDRLQKILENNTS